MCVEVINNGQLAPGITAVVNLATMDGTANGKIGVLLRFDVTLPWFARPQALNFFAEHFVDM